MSETEFQPAVELDFRSTSHLSHGECLVRRLMYCFLFVGASALEAGFDDAVHLQSRDHDVEAPEEDEDGR